MTTWSESIDTSNVESSQVDGLHKTYVDTGLVVDDITGRCSLDAPFLVIDREGWATLHRVMGIRRQNGRRLAVLGPREPWPDGSIPARYVAPEQLTPTAQNQPSAPEPEEGTR